MVLEKTLESPLDCKKIQPIHPKGNQPWIFIGRTDAEAEALILWPSGVKSWFTGKKPDAGKDWQQEEKGTTEDEMVGWHPRFNGHDFDHTLGVGDGQGSLVCCSLWGCKEEFTTEQLNNKNKKITLVLKCWCLKARCSKIVNMRVCATGAPKWSHWQSNKTNNYKKKCCLTRCSHLKTFNDLRGFKVDSRVWTHSWIVCSISSGL